MTNPAEVLTDEHIERVVDRICSHPLITFRHWGEHELDQIKAVVRQELRQECYPIQTITPAVHPANRDEDSSVPVLHIVAIPEASA